MANQPAPGLTIPLSFPQTDPTYLQARLTRTLELTNNDNASPHLFSILARWLLSAYPEVEPANRLIIVGAEQEEVRILLTKVADNINTLASVFCARRSIDPLLIAVLHHYAVEARQNTEALIAVLEPSHEQTHTYLREWLVVVNAIGQAVHRVRNVPDDVQAQLCSEITRVRQELGRRQALVTDPRMHDDTRME